ncbi:type II secretion system protein [Candidatus Kaiserbacteria bacterium]|nr:type II secretion system protein [Candidatus Kaiserbacteria bacterium]
MKTSYKKGFTLIELLVVIAIIGILSSIVLASLNSARQKGRDARRVADIKQIQLALELYYDAHSVYPTQALYATNLVSEGFISTLPKDPSSNLSYAYAGLAPSGTTCTSYHLGAKLETTGHTALSSDADSTGGTVCTSPTTGAWVTNADVTALAGGDFDGTLAQIYDVKP